MRGRYELRLCRSHKTLILASIRIFTAPKVSQILKAEENKIGNILHNKKSVLFRLSSKFCTCWKRSVLLYFYVLGKFSLPFRFRSIVLVQKLLGSDVWLPTVKSLNLFHDANIARRNLLCIGFNAWYYLLVPETCLYWVLFIDPFCIFVL